MQTATPAAEGADFGARLSRLEGIVEQMNVRLTSLESRVDSGFGAVDRRLSAIESSQRQGFFWIVGLMFTSWLSIVGLILWKLGG